MGASIVPKLAKDTMVRGGASPQHVLSDVSVGSKADLTAPRPTSAIPPKADIDGRYRHVRFCQKRTSAHPKGKGMSALRTKADVAKPSQHVRFVPSPEVSSPIRSPRRRGRAMQMVR